MAKNTKHAGELELTCPKHPFMIRKKMTDRKYWCVFQNNQWLKHTPTKCVSWHQSLYFTKMDFLPLKCQGTINRPKVDMPVWTVCLWIPSSPKQKQIWLVKRSIVTLLLVNNLYSGTQTKTSQGTEPQYLHYVPILRRANLLQRVRLSGDWLLTF